jgi:hypothetical protein
MKCGSDAPTAITLKTDKQLHAYKQNKSSVSGLVGKGAEVGKIMPSRCPKDQFGVQDVSHISDQGRVLQGLWST